MTKIFIFFFFFVFCMGLMFVLIKIFKNKHPIPFTKNILSGEKGEQEVANLLRYVHRNNGYTIFNNVLLNGGTDKSVQIDHIIVGRSGLYLIETKNYKGKIYATDEKYWYQQPQNKTAPIPFYSPEKQGLYHLYMLKETLGIKDIKHCHLITVFPNETIIENNSNSKVFHFKELVGEICSYRGNFFTDAKIKEICEKISTANTLTPQNLKKHIQRLSVLYN